MLKHPDGRDEANTWEQSSKDIGLLDVFSLAVSHAMGGCVDEQC